MLRSDDLPIVYAVDGSRGTRGVVFCVLHFQDRSGHVGTQDWGQHVDPAGK
jgi:hypothetical protein